MQVLENHYILKSAPVEALLFPGDVGMVLGPRIRQLHSLGGVSNHKANFSWSMRNGTLAIQSLLRTSAETLGVRFLIIKKSRERSVSVFIIIKKRGTPKTLCFLCRTFLIVEVPLYSESVIVRTAERGGAFGGP